MLAGNQLRSLPLELANCRNLELVRLAANQLEELPQWLLTLPHLSWLAYAGNPCCQTIQSAVAHQKQLPAIDWQNLELGDVLGQGASGVIYKSSLKSLDGSLDGLEGLKAHNLDTVAVKLFKGDITSDGFPRDEMQACMAAGSHLNLVTAIATIANAPDGQAGLVLPFVPNSYQNLGGPPSLDTCTRDTYPEDKTFSVATVVEIALGIANAIAHLHNQGILHGDIYAHNILVNDNGEAVLGDFGAASFYDSTDTAKAPGLERLESRAFGCLLEDLLDRCSPETGVETTIFKGLRRIQYDCMQPIALLRPRFADISDLLRSLVIPSL